MGGAGEKRVPLRLRRFGMTTLFLEIEGVVVIGHE
jgi:hypothetical protein